ncbi:MAG TPA: DUF1232 domain-containing protein [Polyangiaceae bacterium]|nr:DUF1232 domain-containing protein [Polyangiaceae bacterium]
MATWAKVLAAFGLVYALVPLDLVPDLVPTLGWLDDAGVLSLAMFLLARAWSRYRATVPVAPTGVGGAPAAAVDPGSVVVTVGTDVAQK